jgi:hypothetical protein
MGKISGQPKAVRPTCSVCGLVYKHHMLIPGRKMIKNICKCNEYLIDEEIERIRQKRK